MHGFYKVYSGIVLMISSNSPILPSICKIPLAIESSTITPFIGVFRLISPSFRSNYSAMDS